MNPILITYDLKKPERDYLKLIEAIKDFGTWWHCLDSVWIVKTNKSVGEVSDILSSAIDNNDKLLVVDIKSQWAIAGTFPDECVNWLRENL